MLINRQQKCQMKSGSSIEKPKLEHIHRKKTHEPARRNPVPQFMLDPAPPLHRPAPESKRNRPRRQILLNPENLLRLQRAVFIVLGDEMVQPAAVVMLH